MSDSRITKAVIKIDETNIILDKQIIHSLLECIFSIDEEKQNENSLPNAS